MEDSGELNYNGDSRENDIVTNHAQAAITSISDGVRSIIQHIPYNASAALTPENIAKDQMENKTTRDIISKLRTDKIKSKKLRRYTLINGYLLGKKAKGSNELKIMLPLYSGLIMMCIAHLQCHSGLKGTLSIFNRFYDMENKTHAAELVISTCRGCILTKTPNDPKNEFRDGKLKHGTYPREIIAVDFFKIKAGTTVYKQKIEWVMCIVDSFSKFICLYGCLLYTSPSPRD